jgi:hypothetical protein
LANFGQESSSTFLANWSVIGRLFRHSTPAETPDANPGL